MILSKQITLTLAVILAVTRLQVLVAQAKDPRAVLLPESAAKQVKQLCSRESPKVDGVWTPSTTILGTMESRIDKVAELESTHGRIKDPRQSYRQYVGILIEGKRYIYINGMCERPRGDWDKRLQDVCDGGSCFWSVLYNVESGSFSNLQTNGRA
jgi:hypothetical protein